MKMHRLIEKLDVIRGGGGGGGRRSGSDDDSSTMDPFRSSKLWRFSTSYRESLSPILGGESAASNSSLALLRRGDHRLLSCVKFARKAKSNLVTLLVGKEDEERQAFQVEPQILDHAIVQCLLERSRPAAGREDYLVAAGLRAGESPLYEEDILLDCDAILFEHILWLLSRDDPSLRNFNLEELMEFYTM